MRYMECGPSDSVVQVSEKLNLGDLGHRGRDWKSGDCDETTPAEHSVLIRSESLRRLNNLTDQGETVLPEEAGTALDSAQQGDNADNPSVNTEDGGRDEFGSKKKGLVDEKKGNFTKVKDEKRLFIVNVKCGDGHDWDGEKLCRICHLSSDQDLESSDTDMGLIVLGCGCKGELCFAHRHCAEAWFKLKGNRVCEICGQTAQNVTGSGNNRFMETWNARASTSNETNAAERVRGCWTGQPFCNFLMACLVIAFIMPWFFRVNMF